MKITEINPKDAKYYFDNIKVIQAYDKAMQINSKDPLFYSCIGKAFKELGCNVKALEAYNKAMKVNPKIIAR